MYTLIANTSDEALMNMTNFHGGNIAILADLGWGNLCCIFSFT